MKPLVFFTIIAIGVFMKWPEAQSIVSRANASDQMIFNEEGTQGQFVYNVRDDSVVEGYIFC